MERLINYAMLWEPLKHIRNTAGSVCICSNTPLSHADAVGAYLLGKKGITPNTFTLLEAGDESITISSDVLMTVAEVEDIEMTTAGTAKCVALISNIYLLVAVPCSDFEVDVGTLVNVPAWCVSINQPSIGCSV